MIIVAGGDSMVWGSELADCLHCGPGGFSHSTFPAILSNGYDYQCAAFPGNGNDAIARNVIIQCEKNRKKGLDQFVLVMWTFHSRYEFNFEYDNNSSWKSINTWTIGNLYDNVEDLEKNEHVVKFNKSSDEQIIKFAENYFKYIGLSGYWQIYSSIKEILYLQNYLKTYNIPYMFTCVDNILLYNFYTNHNDETMRSIYDQIDMNHWILFPQGTENNETLQPRGFYQWATENKYSIGPVGHPLEKAHIDAAQLIKEKFNEMVTQLNQ
jgi:hypothetical protein